MSHKTDWFHNKKWGMFVHLLNHVQNGPDRAANMGVGATDWSDYIDSLDVELIADQVAEVNAGYLFLTLMQRSKHLLAPNETYNRITGYKPGEACVRRDFVGELQNALNKRGVDLFLYFTGDGPLDDPQAGTAFGYLHRRESEEKVNKAVANGQAWVDAMHANYDKVSMEFVQKWADVVREYSLRYGTNIKAWWVDGCYSFIGYDEPRLKIMADALRAGNPDALVSLNRGVEARVSSYSESDDFTTGEMNDFKDVPDSRFIDGAQWHTMSFLGVPPDGLWNGWAQPGSKYTGEYMKDYVTRVNDRGGVVTIDTCMFRDGHFDTEQMAVLKALKGIRG